MCSAVSKVKESFTLNVTQLNFNSSQLCIYYENAENIAENNTDTVSLKNKRHSAFGVDFAYTHISGLAAALFAIILKNSQAHTHTYTPLAAIATLYFA